jgi:proteic killer suppression protein
MSKKLQLRLAALRAATSLADFWPPKSGPERCHELRSDRSGAFSIDLKQPYRLLFKPIEADIPLDRSNEQERWSKIESIELLGVEDTHG